MVSEFLSLYDPVLRFGLIVVLLIYCTWKWEEHKAEVKEDEIIRNCGEGNGSDQL